MSNIDWLEVKRVGNNMSKIDELKAKLIEYDWTKDIALACDICKWLRKELFKQPKKIEESKWLREELIKQPKKIEVKEG